MPAPRRTNQQQRLAANQQWRAANADLVTWLEHNHEGDRFLSSILRSLAQYGSLTINQTLAVRRNMERVAQAQESVRVGVPATGQSAAERAATPEEASHIFNGIYTMDDGNQHMTFRIHTVRRGNLEGKRIVKVQEGYLEFRGFAFVGRDGQLLVWQRYMADSARSERYIVWANLLLRTLNEVVLPEDNVLHMDNADGGVGGMTIQVTRNCRRCNRLLTVPTSIESGIGPECARRTEANRTTVAPAHQPVFADHEVVEYEYHAPRDTPRVAWATVGLDGRDTQARLDAEQAAADLRSANLERLERERIARSRPDLSELGTGLER